MDVRRKIQGVFMSIRSIRRPVLIAAGILAVAVSGLMAGRIFAHQMGPGHPGMRAARMFERLSRRLDLSDAQKTQIRGILRTQADEIEAQVRTGMEARRALRAAVLAQPIDEASIRTLAQRVGTVQGDGAVLFAKIRAEILPVLTPEQQDRLSRFHDRMQQRGDAALQSLDDFLRGSGN
jgi:Spy/CpxP family protein refolding chaperone